MGTETKKDDSAEKGLRILAEAGYRINLQEGTVMRHGVLIGDSGEQEGSMSGTYKIWIACTEDGFPIVGAACIGDHEAMAAEEQIYPSQMRHRCTAKTADGKVVICTPTTARTAGWDILWTFPTADRSMSRGY